MNEGKRIHDEMHAGMGNLAMSMGPGGFPALVVVASVIIGGLALFGYVRNAFYGPISVIAATLASWFGSASAYEHLCLHGNAYMALGLFTLPFAAVTLRAWRLERAGPSTILGLPVTATVAGTALLAAGWSADVPSQTFLAMHTPGGTLSQRDRCMAEIPQMMRGLQRVGLMLVDCQKYYADATMDDLCRDQVRRLRPLRYPFAGCQQSARRLTGRADWPVDSSLPSWMSSDRTTGAGPVPRAEIQATPEQMRASLKARGIEPLLD